MLVAQTVNSWNKDGLPVDVMFDTNNGFLCYLESAPPWEVIVFSVKLLQSFICLLYCYCKWLYSKNIC